MREAVPEDSTADSVSCGDSGLCSSPEGGPMVAISLGGAPAIPIPVENVSSISPTSSSDEGRMFRRGSLLRNTSLTSKQKSVAWATPNSLHDTRIITPSTHPNRMGQFNGRSAKPSALTSYLRRPCFRGRVDDLAQVALMDKGGIVGWIDCIITVVNSDGTYDINVSQSPLADKHNVSSLAAYAINALHLRTPPR